MMMKSRLKSNLTGMLGVYLTAVELVKRGLVASPTSRSAKGADLLVTDTSCTQTWAVQVKASKAGRGLWLLKGEDAKAMQSPTLVYVFVQIKDGLAPVFYVVPSSVVAATVVTGKNGFSFWRRDDDYLENWKLFTPSIKSISEVAA